MSLLKGCLVSMSENVDFGPSHVLEQNGRIITLKSAWSQETRQVNVASVGIFQTPLYAGYRVQVNLKIDDDSGWSEGIVLKLLEGQPNNLRQLQVDIDGIEYLVDESSVAPICPDQDHALEILEAFNWRAPFRFFARWRMSQRRARWYEDSEGIPALLGARIKPMGHQIYAARRVLWEQSPRFILADEVGLGKTIEAGLILQGLLAAKPDLSVLVIAPGSMTRQWLSELYLRFGARAFTHVDNARWRPLNGPKRRELLESDRLIVSTTVLFEDDFARKAVLGRRWGLVIVDEAHQFEPDAPFFPFLQSLSQQADGFLALSATPSKREVKGILGLLSLIAPEVYSPTDLEGLNKRLAVKQTVWDRLAFTTSMQSEAAYEGTVLKQDALQMIVDEWQGVVDDDPVVSGLLGRMADGQANALDELIAYIQEFYRIDHRLIRTRRATLASLGTQFSQRQVEFLDYEASAAESLLADHLEKLSGQEGLTEDQQVLRGLYYRAFSYTPHRFLEWLDERKSALASGPSGEGAKQAAAYYSDPGPQEEAIIVSDLLVSVTPFQGEYAWLDQAQALARDWAQVSTHGCARWNEAKRWIKNHVNTSLQNKVLVFCQDRMVSEAFAKFLETAFSPATVAMFHHGLEEERLAEVATRFQRQPACRVLVSDELGGEGRNFQMATAVLHLDTPWSLARLEQRIGRLDRIGRQAEHPVLSVVLRGPGDVERGVQKLHAEVFQVFSRSVGGLEFALPRLQRQLYAAASTGYEALVAARDLISSEVDEALRQSDEEFDLALDSARPEIKKASDLAEVIERADFDGTFRDVRDWARVIGLRTNATGEHDIEFNWLTEMISQPLPGMGVIGPGPHRSHGTFDRHRALDWENLQLFAPGHRLVDGLLASLRQGPEGRATVFTREMGAQYRGHLYMLLLGHCAIPSGEETIPAGLLTRAHRRIWPQVVCVSLALRLGQDPSAQLVEDLTLKRLLEADYQGKNLEPKIEPEMLLRAVKQPQLLWQSVREAVSIGLAAIQAERRPLVDAAVRDLREDLRNEMGFFAGQAGREQGAEANRARKELALREQLLEQVGNEMVNLDSIALVYGI